MSKDQLITTKLEHFLDGGNTIYLGDWCETLGKSDDVLSYHWEDRTKYKLDYDYTIEVYERLLPIISSYLNDAHGLNKELRYWRILVGPWLLFCVQTLFDRWETIRCASRRENMYTTVFQDELDSHVAFSTHEFMALSSESDLWNHLIFREIISYFCSIQMIQSGKNFKKKLETRFGHVCGFLEKNFRLVIFNSLSIIMRLIRFDRLRFVYRTTNFFSRERKTSFSFKFVDNIQRMLFDSSLLTQNSTKTKFRRQALCFNAQNKFEEFLTYILPSLMPKLYLEYFESMNKLSLSRGLPISPNLILTSNSIYFDELFKFWLAYTKSHINKLIIYQHGGGYGAQESFCLEDHELKVSDYFLSWGWERAAHTNIIPYGYYVNPKRSLVSDVERKKLLVVMTTLPRYAHKLTSEPQSSNYKNYLWGVNRFLLKLKTDVLKNIVIRPYPQDFGWHVKKRLLLENTCLKFENDGVTMTQSLQNSLLSIHTHNSTTILESIRREVPTIIFLNINYYEIRKEVRDIFSELKQVGVFHDNADSLSCFLNRNIDNISTWWNEEDTKLAVKRFELMFAKNCNHRVLNL